MQLHQKLTQAGVEGLGAVDEQGMPSVVKHRDRGLRPGVQELLGLCAVARRDGIPKKF